MSKVLIVGGSGFVGRAIQKYVLTEGIADDYVFSFNSHSRNVDNRLSKVQLNLSLRETVDYKVSLYHRAIYLVGGNRRYSDEQNVEIDILAFLNFMKYYRGSLVLLSSQAVYDDLDGKVSENVDHVVTHPRAITKQALESFAKHFAKVGWLTKLCILRSKYIFGEGEENSRLIPQLARKKKTKITDGGKAVLSLLPVGFVARILVKTEKEVSKIDTVETIMNMNYPSKITVKDVLDFLLTVDHSLDFEITDEPEVFPVRYYGDTSKLRIWMERWDERFPNIWEEVRRYYFLLREG